MDVHDSLASLPTTPFNKSKPRNPHHPSPAFSNYFSDDDTSTFSPINSRRSPQYTAQTNGSPPQSGTSITYFDSPGKSEAPPYQMALIERLQDMCEQINSRDLDDHIRMALEIKLNELERTLIAPDVQSRESAEGSDSALFLDDDDESQEKQQYAETIADYEAQLKQSSRIESGLQARLDSLRDKVEHLQDMKELHELQIHDRDVTIQSLKHQNVDLVKSLRSARDDLFQLVIRVEAIDMLTSQRAKQDSRDKVRAKQSKIEEQQATAGYQASRDVETTTFTRDSGEHGDDYALDSSEHSADDDERDDESDSDDEGDPDEKSKYLTNNDKQSSTHQAPERLQFLLPKLRKAVQDVVRPSPWQELWQGLSDLSGGPRDHD